MVHFLFKLTKKQLLPYLHFTLLRNLVGMTSVCEFTMPQKQSKHKWWLNTTLERMLTGWRKYRWANWERLGEFQSPPQLLGLPTCQAWRVEGALDPKRDRCLKNKIEPWGKVLKYYRSSTWPGVHVRYFCPRDCPWPAGECQGREAVGGL